MSNNVFDSYREALGGSSGGSGGSGGSSTSASDALGNALSALSPGEKATIESGTDSQVVDVLVGIAKEVGPYATKKLIDEIVGDRGQQRAAEIRNRVEKATGQALSPPYAPQPSFGFGAVPPWVKWGGIALVAVLAFKVIKS